MKKILSIILSVFLLMSILPSATLTAAAETYDIFEYSVSDGEVTITGCDKNAVGSIAVPAEIDGYPVTRVNYDGFDNCEKITDITIPFSVIDMDLSLDNCAHLTDIYVDEGNENYSSVDGVVFNKSKTRLITYPFGKTGEYTIPDGVTEIAIQAFPRFGMGPTSITIPGSVSSFNWAFVECTQIKNVTILEGVTSISDLAFYGCHGIENITIPSSVRSIGTDAFSYCMALKSITLPDGIRQISEDAFYFCISLESIVIPDGVTSILDKTFFYCTELKSITIPSSVTYIDGYAFDCMDIFTIYGDRGSYAEEYANAHDIPFVPIGKVKEINITVLPNKKIYPIGGKLNTTDMVVTAKFDNDETIDVTADYCSIEKYDFSTAGEKSIRVTYAGLSTEFTVTVDENLICYPESEHPYISSDIDQVWEYVYKTDAEKLLVTFSENTELRKGNYLYIYDVNSNQIGEYNGTELSGQTIEIPGNAIKIRMDSSAWDIHRYYGFEIVNIQAVGATAPKTIVLKKEQTQAYINGAMKPTTDYGNGIRAKAMSKPGGYVLPLRFIGEKFGMTVDYLGGGQTKITNVDGTYLIVNKGSATISKYYPNGTLKREIENTVATFTEDGVTYVPLRAVSEALGLGVRYQSTSHGSYVVISTNQNIDSEIATVNTEIENAYALGL